MANHNKEIYIKQAIESILNQTYKKWELIIVDDASTDNSVKIIKKYLKDKRIKLIIHTQNLGCGKTKKDCADNAKGDIMGQFDSDDILNKNAIKIMVEEHYKNPNCGLIYSSYYDCDDKINIISKGKLSKNKNNKQTNLDKQFVSHFATFKRSYYNKTLGFNSNLKKAVDKDLYYKLEEITKLKFINKPIYYYRRYPAGISQEKNNTSGLLYDLKAKKNAHNRRKKLKIKGYRKKIWSKDLFNIGYSYLIKKDLKNAKKYILKSILKYPLNLKYGKTFFKRIILKIPLND